MEGSHAQSTVKHKIRTSSLIHFKQMSFIIWF